MFRYLVYNYIYIKISILNLQGCKLIIKFLRYVVRGKSGIFEQKLELLKQKK